MKFELKHGGGGEASRKIVEKIKNYLDNEVLSQLDDAGIFNINGSILAFTTDSFTVKPLFFRGGDIGKLAVTGTVNDLVSMGAQPLFLSLAFIIEEGFFFQDFDRILKSISKACEETGVSVITGDTKVVEKGGADGIFVNTSGVGRILIEPPPSLSRIAPGDLLIITGTIAEHGASILIERNFPQVKTSLKSDCAALWPGLKAIFSPAIKFMRDPSRGGLAAVVNEMVQNRNFGVLLEEEKIPLRDEVRALCEMLGIDPLSLASEGRMLLVVDGKKGEEILASLQKKPEFREAAIIGHITEENAGKVVLRTLLGSERLLLMPSGENLPRIC